jgi:hypothetical protein
MIAELDAGPFLVLTLVAAVLVLGAAVFGLRWWLVRHRAEKRRSLCPEEMRESPREPGKGVMVLVADGEGAGPREKAQVLDQSRGGLRLLCERVFSVGTVLSVRGPRAGKKAWLRIRVTHCLRSGPRWEVGCQFLQKPSAKQLRHLS